MSDSAFDTTTSQTNDTQQTQIEPTDQSQPSAFEALVGEGKKFNDAEALARGKQESDTFIKQLQTELQGLREDLDKRMTSEEVLTKIREEAATNSATTGENTTPQLGKDDIAELVKQTLESTRTEETKDRNLMAVDQKLAEVYGDKRAEWLNSEAHKLGVSIDFLADVAKASPDAFFNTVGLSSTVTNTTASVTTGTVNTETVAQVTEASGIKPNTMKYFDAIKKEDPRKYWTPAVQNALFAAREEMGPEAFYA